MAPSNAGALMRLSAAAIVWLVAMVIFRTGAGAAPTAPGLTVFAASSLTDALRDIGTLWIAQGHKPATFIFAASSTLALQIEHGAPADVFASADELWMDKLAQAQRIDPRTRSDITANALVLIEPKSTLKPVTLQPGVDLTAILGPSGRLAVGDPAHVPAGIYAEQALKKLGLWNAVETRLAPADNVRSAMMLVTTGEAPAGIVYATDARVVGSLGIAATFPPDSHDPIRYPTAATANGNKGEAVEFIAFLHTQSAQDVFEHYGFLRP
jgi:molybdate transport system substrate-binding protein